MAGKVFFSVTMSLDGFVAPEAVPVEDLFGPERSRTTRGCSAGCRSGQNCIRRHSRSGSSGRTSSSAQGGEEGLDNDISRATHERTGASVMGKRMFDAGELSWPEEAPFHTPVFVVTHEKRDPWERPGGTTFHFVNDGIEPRSTRPARPPATETSASPAAAKRSWSTSTPAWSTSSSITLSPVLFGSGIRLFDGVDAGRVALEPVRAEPSPRG